MGLFSLLPKDDAEIRKAEMNYMERCSKKIDGYTKSLDRLSVQVSRLEALMKERESVNHNQQMDNVNFALDLKYLKEQGDQVSEQMDELLQRQFKDVRQQLEKNHSQIVEVKQEMEQQHETKSWIKRKIGSISVWIKFVFAFQFVILLGIIVLFLNACEIITF